MVLTTILEFKHDHPVNYWVRLLCISFSAVFLLLWADGLSENARADIDIFDINAGTEDLEYGWGDDIGIAICPSNRWYFPYMNSDGDFNVSWSDNNGTSWSNVTVQSEGWKGETKMRINSIQTWVNNTTVIILNTEGADNAYDAYLFWLWGENPASDPASWNYTTIAVGGTKPDHLSMIFNRTGMLHIVYNQNNAIRSRLWDIETGAMEADSIWAATNGYPAIQCDHNNNVWVAYQVSGTSGNLWIWNYEETVSMTVADWSGRYKWSTFFITEDNTKVLTGYYTYLGWRAVIRTYETVVNTTINVDMTTTTAYTVGQYWATGNVYGNTVSVILMRTTAGQEEFIRYRAVYDAIDATWEGSETVLWTVPTTTDISYHMASGPNSVWPKIDGVSVQRFISGDMHYWHFKDDLATDEYYDIVYTDDPVFTYWNWSAPEVPDPDPDPGGGNETNMGAVALWWSDAGCISAGMIAMVIVLVAVLVISDRRI